MTEQAALNANSSNSNSNNSSYLLDQDEKYNAYLRWLTENGCIFPSLDYPVYFPDSGLVGTRAKIDITPNKALLFVPYSVTISLFKAKKSEISHIFLEHSGFFISHPRGDDHILWTFIMYERLKGETSFWHPYFETIKGTQTVIDWNDEELESLQDPILIYEAKQWKVYLEKLWQSVWKILKEYPQYFPPEKDVKGTFEWVWRVACTRLFAWEDGMLIPLADNLNHDDGYIRYESEYKCVLEEISKSNKGDTDYRDFSNESHSTIEFDKARFYRTKIEKYLDNSSKNQKIEIDAIWELDEELKNYRSSSDEEDTRVIGELTSEDEDEYEESNDLEIRDEPESYFILTTGVRTGFKAGEQVFNAYGRLSNRDLLLDYGFTLENNRYDAVYFRIWTTRSMKTGLLFPEDYEQKQWKTDGHLIDDVSELYTIKRKKLNTQIFSYFRATVDFSVPELAGVGLPTYYGTPCLPKLELYIIDKILALYSQLARYFSTPLEYDLQLLSTNLPIRERNAV